MISSGSYATSVKFTIAIVTALRGIPMKNAKFLLLPSAFLLASCGAGIPDSSSTMEEASLDSSLPASSPSDVSETPSESPSSEEKPLCAGSRFRPCFLCWWVRPEVWFRFDSHVPGFHGSPRMVHRRKRGNQSHDDLVWDFARLQLSVWFCCGHVHDQKDRRSPASLLCGERCRGRRLFRR